MRVPKDQVDVRLEIPGAVIRQRTGFGHVNGYDAISGEYFSLAAGFLTGKYRSEADFGKSPRGARMAKYLDGKGNRILEALDKVSAETGAPLAEIALAWLLAQPGITAPIASATSVEQLNMLARGIVLPLRHAHVELLTEAGR